jgi:hypothetical protein
LAVTSLAAFFFEIKKSRLIRGSFFLEYQRAVSSEAASSEAAFLQFLKGAFLFLKTSHVINQCPDFILRDFLVKCGHFVTSGLGSVEYFTICKGLEFG